MSGKPKTQNMALFCDFENVALGVRDAKYAAFDIQKVLERLLLKGNIVVKKAYCDWGRYKEFKATMHEAAFELIDIPHVRQSGKNSADIRMVVDALDLCYTKSHVDTFVIISGDSDFSAREAEKHRRAKPKSTPGKAARKTPVQAEEQKKQEALDLVLETVEDLFEERGEEEKVWGSMVKQALKRRKPGFSESYHGFRTFGKLLEEAQARKLLELEHDEKSGGYIIKSFAHEA
jgi:hypothetical protein